jgi:hypothetical protein
MTDDTASAADSAQETITLVDPVTGDQWGALIDEVPDHGVMALDVGGFAPEPYEPRMDLKLNLRDGTRVSIQDGPGHSVLVELTNDDQGVSIDVELSDHDVDHLRTLLLRANLAGER